MRFQNILAGTLDRTMYKKVHHNLKKRPTKMGWAGLEINPFPKVAKQRKTGLDLHVC